MTTGDRIRAMRRRAGLSMRQLGAAVGVSAMAVSKWERGITSPTSEHLLALAAALGVKACTFCERPVTVTLSGGHFWRYP